MELSLENVIIKLLFYALSFCNYLLDCFFYHLWGDSVSRIALKIDSINHLHYALIITTLFMHKIDGIDLPSLRNSFKSTSCFQRKAPSSVSARPQSLRTMTPCASLKSLNPSHEIYKILIF